MVEMKFVDSSNIEAIGYDDDKNELHSRFIKTGLYIYSGVPKEVFDELSGASSTGSYFNRHIKPIYQQYRKG